MIALAEGGRLALAGKMVHVRQYVLERIERGEWTAGSALPGARDLAETLGISFVKVQQGLETLSLDGVLETRARVGTFVRHDWKDRILRDNLSVFNKRQNLPWIEGMEEILAREMPGVRLTDAFPRSTLEIKTLLHVQMNHDHYLDLSGILEQVLADVGPVFNEPFTPCRIGKRIVGVPIIASPRFICFNPELLRKHGCPLPANGWSWDDFMAIIRHLRPLLDPSLILDWVPLPYYWLNVVMRAGGHIFAADAEDPIIFDSPAARRGLRLFRDLGEVLGRPMHDIGTFVDAFASGQAAMAIGTRQFTSQLRMRGWDGWQAVPLPLIPGGRDTTSQAADLACVRDTCTDPELARRFITLMLSASVQDHLAGLHYGIPIRKNSALQTLDLSDQRETLVLGELGKMSWEPCMESADLTRFVLRGLTRILDLSQDIDADAIELAKAARLHLAAQHHNPFVSQPAYIP
jgi:DNA-binding transcriptional regulator YhcF (GntR family)